MGRKKYPGKLRGSRPYLDTADSIHHPGRRRKNIRAGCTAEKAGQPAEPAGAYVLLASQESSNMTCSTIEVTGGTPTI